MTAFQHLLSKLSDAFPETTFTENFPSAEDRPALPFCSVLIVGGRQPNRYGGTRKQLVQKQEGGNLYYMGEIESNLALNYFFKKSESAEDIISNMILFFGGGSGWTLELKYGPGEWETSRFSLVSQREATRNPEVSRGERKLEFFVNSEWPRTHLQKGETIFKKFEIEGDVSENPNIGG